MSVANRLQHTYRLAVVFALAAALASCTDEKNANPTTGPQQPGVTYVVTFDSQNGSDVVTDTVERGKTATEPTPPTRQGFAFLGWYSGAAATATPFDFKTAITANLILYARWAQRYTVTFHTGKGTLIAPLEPVTVEQGKTAPRPEEPKKIDGPFMEKDITLVGWYTDANLNNDQAFDFATTPITSDTTLYARYAYLISTEGQLAAVDNNLAGLYRLQNDIDLTSTDWKPIAGESESGGFIGHFEGGGHLIKNLKITSPSLGVGLFGIVGAGGVVQAVGLEGASITAGGNFGTATLVGYNEGKVSGYALGGKVSAPGSSKIGGLVGSNSGELVGYAQVEVEGSIEVGGLVGNNEGKVSGYAVGKVSGVEELGFSSINVGGLLGNNGGASLGYARGNVVRGTNGVVGNAFGLVSGDNYGSSLTGYHSSKAGESQPMGFSAGEQRTGYDGDPINYDATPKPTVDSFKDFAFGTAHGEWIWVDGRWPYINIEGIPAERQDVLTLPTIPTP